MADETKVTFDSAQYDKLIKMVDGKEKELYDKFLAASSSVRLAPDMGTMVKIGSTTWPKLDAVIKKLEKLGTDAEARNKGMSDDWQSFVEEAADARKVFEDTDDLAKYEASKFTSEYPDMGPQGAPK